MIINIIQLKRTKQERPSCLNWWLFCGLFEVFLRQGNIQLKVDIAC